MSCITRVIRTIQDRLSDFNKKLNESQPRITGYSNPAMGYLDH